MDEKTFRVPEDEYRALYRVCIEARAYVKQLDVGGGTRAERAAWRARNLAALREALEHYAVTRRALDAAAAASAAAVEVIAATAENR
jgi:hypothetical protein